MKKCLLLLVALLANVAANAQYVFVIGSPANGGEFRVGKSLDLGVFMDGSSLIDDAAPGETVYFDFRPYSGWQFTEIAYDENLSSDDVTLRPDGIYSFTMPEYDGLMMIMIYVGFEKIPEVVTGVDINETNFPDPNFRAWLLAQDYGSDAVITDYEMSRIGKITARALGITDLTGIQHFSELTELDVSNNPELHAVDTWNRISSIDLSGNTKLRKMWLNNNLFSSLDLSPCPDLRTIDASENLLTSLDLSHSPSLSLLFCTNNQLSSLDLSHNPDLGVLGCYGNFLTTLDLSNNPLLEQVYCENNQISSLNVANHNKLMILNCNDNQLTSLDLTGCTELFQLYCYNNKIKGEGMVALVNSVEAPPRGGYMVVIDLASEIEENEMTADQVSAVRAKGWSVESISGDINNTSQYNGMDGGDETTYEYVDLGLPSGTLWATRNVGANRTSDAGLFFAWGDITGHGADVSDGYLFNWENYVWCNVVGDEAYFTKYCTDSNRGKNGFTDGKYSLDPEDDAAYVTWGPEWRMPTKRQQDELKEECEWILVDEDGFKGYEVKGPNGNSIFLPETGWRIDDMLLDGGAYWSRTFDPESMGGAYYIGFDEWGEYIYGGRLDGQCIRPVVYVLYSISVPESFENGSVTCDRDEAGEDDTVILTVTPDDGYVLETLTVTTDGGTPSGAPKHAPRRANIETKLGENGTYTFMMPADDVTVTATFKHDSATGLEEIEATMPKSSVRYNVLGQPVGKDYKGIVIENGVKRVIK